MADRELPADIAAAVRIPSTSPIDTGEDRALPTQSFSSFMKEGAGSSPLAASGKTSMISPFDLMHGQPPLAQAPTMETLLAQINSAQSTMGDINSQLNTPNLKLKSSTKYVMKNKLTDANASLRTANAKMGAQVPEETNPSQFGGPLGKFFSYLSDGQAQLESAKSQLQNLKSKGDNISPGDFLLIQVKLNKAQQELEFTSVLLSNAVSDIKQMMQVQL